MEYLPLFMSIRDRHAVVVGGGGVAARKARLLARAGARVTAIAPGFGAEMHALAAERAVALAATPFAAAMLEGAAVVVAATGTEAADAEVSAAAQARGIPVNVVDRPALSTFIVPAIVDRDPVVIGISTGGAAPVLARRIRASVESVLPPRLGRLAAFARSFRAAVAARIADGGDRRRFWEGVLNGPVAASVLAGDEAAARREMIRSIDREGERAAGRGGDGPAAGMVHIVGAGPGDPELLTLKAQRLLQTADVIVYDRLVGEGVLDHARRDAVLVYVGKAKGTHARTQTEINAILCRHAAAGRRVVRLKGGDPFVFGRGGEEVAALAEAGIATEVVPGITAATGCGAVAGIPLTHRDYAQGVVFVTGHAKDGEPALDWGALARLRQTIVVYMGAGTAGAIARRLIEHGLPASTPAAVVVDGTRPGQRVARGRLDDLDRIARDCAEGAPALLIIGDVAGLPAAQATARHGRHLAV